MTVCLLLDKMSLLVFTIQMKQASGQSRGGGRIAEGAAGLSAGVLVVGAPGACCLFGDREWSHARRQRWRFRGESAVPDPPHCVALLPPGFQFPCRRLGIDEA